MVERPWGYDDWADYTRWMKITIAITIALITTIGVGWFLVLVKPVWLVIGILVGLLAPPLAIVVFRSGLVFNGTIGRFMFLLGQVSAGGSVLLYRDTDAVFCPARRTTDPDGAEFYHPRNGWTSLVGELVWFRLGLRRFGISYEKPARAWGDALLNKPIPGAGPGVSRARADGGTPTGEQEGGDVVLLESRGGEYLYGTVDPADADGWVLHVPRFVGGLGRAGTHLIPRTVEEGLKEYANRMRMDQKWFIIILLLDFFGAFVLTWFLLGL